MTWPVDKVLSWYNVKLIKLRMDTMVSQWNGELKHTNLTQWNSLLTRLVVKVLSWYNVKLTKWQTDVMISQWNGELITLKFDKMKWIFHKISQPYPMRMFHPINIFIFIEIPDVKLVCFNLTQRIQKLLWFQSFFLQVLLVTELLAFIRIFTT